MEARVGHYIVKISTKYIADFWNMTRAAALNPGSQINPADYVNIIGTVVSVPKAKSSRHDYRHIEIGDVKPGDTLIFSCYVIFDFEFNEEGEPIYKNEFWVGDKEYWRVDLMHAFAYIRNDEIRTLSDYVLVQDVSEPSALVVPRKYAKILLARTGTIVAAKIPEVEGGDTVYFDGKKVQMYQINNKKFGILRGKHIYAYKIGSFANSRLFSQ